MTLLTIQCACSKRRMMSRLAPTGAGILGSIGAIEPRTSPAGQIAARLAITMALLAACDDVEGGAVELSWKLRPASSSLEDKFVECRTAIEVKDDITDEIIERDVEILEMRLEWSVTTENNDIVTGSDQWPCSDSHGVTGFDLPAGTA